MSFPHYKRYRDSVFTWFGRIPDHWAMISLGRITLEKCDGPFGSGLKSEHYVESGVRVVRLQNIRAEGFEGSNAVFIDETYFRRSLTGHDVRPDDLLIAGLGDDNNTVGRACVAPPNIEPAIVKADCFRFRLDLTKVLPHFLAAQLSASSRADAGNLSSGSTRSRIPLSLMAGRRIALPPLAEQKEICAFLDREVTKVNQLVAEQHYLITLLKEKRQAITSFAVTKGLTAHAQLKDSGIEWIGAVPKRWENVRLGTLFKESADPGNDALPVLSVSIHHGVSDREFDEEEMDRKVTRSEDRSKYIRVQPGDLVYNMMRAWQGGFGTVQVQGMVSPAYVVARPKAPICTEYVEQLLRTPNAIEELRRHSHGITDFRLRLYWDEFKSIKISVPPVNEQRDILAFLGNETAKIDALIAESKSAIALLHERRSAVIAAAVTGKIDVRGLINSSREQEVAA